MVAGLSFFILIKPGVFITHFQGSKKELALLESQKANFLVGIVGAVEVKCFLFSVLLSN